MRSLGISKPSQGRRIAVLHLQQSIDTHFTFSPALIARLATLPTVTAVKMPLPAGGDFAGQIAALRADLPPDFAIGYSGDWGCPDALLNHADGWFSVAAGLWPDQTLTLACAARAGDRPETARWQARFQPMWDLFQPMAACGSFMPAPG